MSSSDPEQAAGPAAKPGVPRSVHLLIVVLASSSIAVGVAAGRLGGQPPTTGARYVVPLLGTLIIAGVLQLRYHYRNHVEALDLFEAVIAPSIVAFPGPIAVALVAAGKAISQCTLRVQPVKAAFNTAQWSLAAAVGSMVFGLGRISGSPRADDLLRLVPAMVALSVVNRAALVAVLALVDHRSPRRVLTELAPVMLPGWVIGGGIVIVFGVLFTAAFDAAPLTIVLFAVPLWLLHWASRSYGISLAHRARLRGLQEATHVLAVPVDPRDALPDCLTAVRKCFDAEMVELVVVEPTGWMSWTAEGEQRPSCRLLSAEQQEPRKTLLQELGRAQQAVEIPADLLASAAHEQLTSRLEVRDCLAAPVEGGAGVQGMLCVYNRNGFEGSDEGELGVITALAGELGSALEKGALLDAINRERVKLEESEARFRVLVQDSSDMVCVIAPAGTVCYASPAFGRMVGAERAEPGQGLLEVIHPDDRAMARETLQRCAAGPASRLAFECRFGTVERSWRAVEILAQNLLDSPSIKGLVLNSRDITDRKRAENLLAKQAEVLESIARDAPLYDTLVALTAVVGAQLPESVAAIVLDDPTDRLRIRTGSSLQTEVLDELDRRLTSAQHRGGHVAPQPLIEPQTISLDAADSGESEFDTARSAGFRAVWLIPLRNAATAETSGVIAVYRCEPYGPDAQAWQLLGAVARLADVAVERVRSQADLAHQATHDTLTGLPNRLLFADRLAAATARMQRKDGSVVVMFIDLDGFKAVNDGMGHDAGDKLLVECARRLRSAVRPWDTVARFGGDEFTVLCEDVRDDEEAALIAHRIRRSLSEAVHLPAGEVFVTASIGIARASAALGRRLDQILESADRAMYQAKRQGGNTQVFFDHQLQSRMRHRLLVQTELHHAIEQRQFCLFYQPIVCLRTGEFAGVEALLRWNHPSRGLIGPAEFIEEAERSGLIIEIGRLVIEDAARQASEWLKGRVDRGNFVVNVNLSALQFTRHDLVDVVARAMKDAGTDPAVMHFEITESVLMDDIEATTAALARLKTLGVGLVIDDFGTGYSSLSYLKRFPVDGLKIDQSFVKGLEFDREDAAIASAVIKLAHTLGLIAIAEGVETAGQLAELKRLGCDYAQGYFLGYPSAPTDMPTLQAAGAAF